MHSSVFQSHSSSHLHDFHDANTVLHPGVMQFYLMVGQRYSWRGMRKDVEGYVRSCEQYQQKIPGSRAQYLMQPIPVPPSCWEVISTDFLTHLQVLSGYDAIQVVVWKLSKRPCYIPTDMNADAKVLAKLIFLHCFNQYGILSVIISDRDPWFTSVFWSELMRLLRVKVSIIVAHRAQSDGQSESSCGVW